MNFNLAPYNDTYSKLDNYYKVLFKPSRNIQARELNELQSILQNQVTSLGDHLFKNGSIISGCSSSFIKYDFITVTDHNIDLENGLKLVGQNFNIEAKITKISGNHINLIYTKTGSDGTQNLFQENEAINVIKNDSIIGTLNVSTENPTGKSLIFNIDQGIFYYNGYFIKVHSHSIITEKYLVSDENGLFESDKSYRVGLDVVEEIITSDEDLSLNDPHIDSPNFGAPGADRFKISLNLSIKSYNDNNSYNFILLAKVKQNLDIDYHKKDTEYAEIMKEFARRFYETYGDFNIIPWKSKYLNEYKNNAFDKTGWSLSGNDDNYVSIISPGLGYVKGYRIETISDTIVSTNKPRETKIIEDYEHPLDQLQHILVSVSTNNLLDNIAGPVEYDQTFSLLDENSEVIGTFKISDIAPVNGTIFKLYVKDLSIVSNKNIKNSVSVKSGSLFEGTIQGNKILNGDKVDKLFYSGKSYIKSVGDLKVSNREKFVGTLDSEGIITFTTTGEFVAGGYGWITSDNFQITPSMTSISLDKKSLTVDLGNTKASEEVLYVASVNLSITRKTKTKTKHIINQDSAPTENTNDIMLNHSDVFLLESVILTNTSGTDQVNITKEYTLYTGQTDDGYGTSYLRRNFYRDFNSSDRLIITYYYHEHGSTGDYFDVLSYDCDYGEIGSYKNYNLSDYFDFRGSTLNIDLNSKFSFDCEFYLPRYDLLLVNTDGEFYIKNGIPSETPIIPYEDSDSLVIAELYIDPYCVSDKDIKVKHINNKAYKTPDIIGLKRRASDLEEMVTLSLLEQNTINMSIKDQNGYDRYKNGYLIDNFKGYYSSDINNVEFKSALDRKLGILRPEFNQNNVKLEYNESNSSNITSFGNVVLSNFKNDLFITNPYATQDVSINPYFIFRTTGTVKLSPNIDTWSDTDFQPTITSTIDTGVGAFQSLSDELDVSKTEFGSWSELNRSTVIDTTVEVEAISTGTRETTTRTTNTTVNSSRVVTSTGVQSKTSTFTVNDAVKDISISPMIRPKTIQFYASNMKPNTRLYAYFDGIDVTKHCKGFQQLDKNNDVLVNRSISIFGEHPLVTNEDGDLNGEFRIPADTFFTGEKLFVLTNDPKNSGNTDIETTRSETTYFAGGVSQTKQSYNLNIVTPNYGTTSSIQLGSNTTTTVARTTRDIPAPEIPGLPEITRFRIADVRQNWHAFDWRVENVTNSEFGKVYMEVPTGSNISVVKSQQRVGASGAQFVPGKFTLVAENEVGRVTSTIICVSNDFAEGSVEGNSTPSQTRASMLKLVRQQRLARMRSRDPVAQAFKVEESCFISKIGIYFSAVDTKQDTIWFEIRELVNGYPSTEYISRKEVKSSALYDYVSDDASKEYQIEFSNPTYVDSNKSYCIVIGGYSPDTRVFISKLGSQLLNSEDILEVPPLTYTMFRSLNGETWNAEQFDTLKFNLYRCIFDTSESTITLVSETPLNYKKAEQDPIEFQPNSNRVRVYVKNHGLRVNDRFILDFNKDVYSKLEATTGIPQIGQPISTVSGSAIVKDIQATSTLNLYNVSFEKMKGTFVPGQEYTCEFREVTYRDLFLINDNGAYSTPVTLPQNNGYIRESVFEETIGGSDITLFSKEHIVREVDSIDSVIIEIEDSFISQGRFGGSNVHIYGSNIQYNMINVSGQYMPYNTKDSWILDGFTLDGNPDKSYQIIPSYNVDLDNTNIVLSESNESRSIGKGTKSINITLKFTPSSYISPVINVDSFSATLITNRIESLDVGVYSKLPIGESRYIEESDPYKGVESFKYVSTRALLENPAIDMKVLLEVNCPNEADFDIYVKLISANNVNIDDKKISWQKIDKYEKVKTKNDKNDFIEYSLLLSNHMSTYNENMDFIAYRVKIVGKSTNKCRPPLFKNLRAIAVT